jgi:transcriptional regulator with XRE-family HTH domain
MASLGDSLREEREARNISLEEIASATKIVPRYLEALETDRLDLMPGGFFIRAIIRSYAQAVGLDPDEVVERYKAAGMLEPPEPSRGIFSRRAAPAPVLADQAPAVAPPVPVEAPIPAVEIPASMERPEPGVLFEEAAAKPGRPLMTRQQMRVWTWRGLAALGIVLVALILWSPWHRHPAPIGRGPVTVRTQLPAANPAAKPAEKTVKPTEAAKPPEKTPTETGRQAAQAVSKTAAEAPPAVTGPPAPKPEAAAPAPASGEIWKGITIEIVFDSETSIQVYADGALRIGGVFPVGASARAQANETLLIHTGNAGGFTFKLNGRPAKPLGGPGQVLTDIKITLENLKDFLEAPSSGPTG